MNSENKGYFERDGYVYRIGRRGEATKVRISSGDLTILKIYKERYKKPITTIIHEMIGTAAKCWEEKHEFVIDELRKDLVEFPEKIKPSIKSYNEVTKYAFVQCRRA